MNENYIPINTYHQQIIEAFSALHSSFCLLREAEECDEELDLQKGYLYRYAVMQARYAFLLAANALEAAANGLLLSLELSSAQYEDLEKLSTLLKFEIFCNSFGKKLNRGNMLYARVKDVVKCRNEFVHPKPQKASFTKSSQGLEVNVKRTSIRNYPMSFEFLEPDDTLIAVGNILAFLSWVVFDICEMKIREGSLCLGYGSSGSIGTVFIMADEHGFDTRTFGEELNGTFRGPDKGKS